MMPTSASAAEFVRGYYRVLNAAATSGDDSGLAGLTVSPSCSYCHDQLRDLTDFARHHQHTSGPAWVIRSVQAYPVVARASTVTVTIEAPAIRLLDANGVVVDTLPYRPTYAVSVEATWTGRGWGVTNIVEFA
jgi:hypothetical protein